MISFNPWLIYPAGIPLLPFEWKAAWVKKPVQIFFGIEKEFLVSFGGIETQFGPPALLHATLLSAHVF
jgi:hypothetical protein